MSSAITIRDLHVSIGRKKRKPILKGIDLDIPSGLVQGVAGESGSGKTMTGMAIMGLLPPDSHVSGSIRYGDKELVGLTPRAHNAFRGAEIAMVQQDPTASLHPMLTIEHQLTDHYRAHTGATKADARDRAVELLDRVAVPDPEVAIRKYPHQFSGGQLQRVAIASALMCHPKVLIADEPTTALDVTVQAGVLRLLRGLCDELGLSIMLITHDLGVMSALADRIAVMRYGQIVEEGHRRQIITDPQHDYTKALINALPEQHETQGAPR